MDSLTTVRGITDSLYLPPGMLIFTVTLVFALGAKLRSLHLKLRESRDMLMKTNVKLRGLNRIKNNFFFNTSKIMSQPISNIVETAHALIDKRRSVIKHEHIKMLLRLADTGNEMLNLYKRIEYYFSELKKNKTSLITSNLNIFLKKQKIILENQYPVTIKLILHEDLPLVNADLKSLRNFLYELSENTVRHSECRDITISAIMFSHDEILVKCRISGKSSIKNESSDILEEFETGNTSHPGAGLGIPLMHRIIELHESNLKISSGTENNRLYTDYSFKLNVARAESSKYNKTSRYNIRHVRFLNTIGCDEQARREITALRQK